MSEDANKVDIGHPSEDIVEKRIGGELVKKLGEVIAEWTRNHAEECTLSFINMVVCQALAQLAGRLATFHATPEQISQRMSALINHMMVASGASMRMASREEIAAIVSPPQPPSVN